MFIDVPGAKLFALRHGNRSAQTIVGVGGWVGNSELWAEPFALLSDRWSTIAYDHRGTGASVGDADAISLSALVDDVFAVMDAFGVERAVLAAESAGALTALMAALARPERISHLVIVDGMYETGTVDRGWAEFLLDDYDRAISGFVRDCIPEPGSEHLVEWGRKMLLRASPAHAVALLGVAAGDGPSAHLSEVVQPTLVIHGALDALIPVAKAEELVASLPNARLRLIDDAGHVPTVTRPDEVAEAMAEFLTAHAPQGDGE